MHAAKRYGVLVLAGKVNMENILIDSTQSDEQKTRGRGLGMFFGYFDVTVKNSLFENNQEFGITTGSSEFGAYPVGNVDIKNIIVRNTKPEEKNRIYGRGFNIVDGPFINLKQAFFSDNYETGIFIRNSNPNANFEELIIDNILCDELTNKAGLGIIVDNESNLECKRCLIKNCRGSGILAYSKKTNLYLEDSVIIDTKNQCSDKVAGYGIWVRDGVNFEFERILLESNTSIGLNILNESEKEEDIITGQAKDIIINKTLSQNELELDGGFGLFIFGDISFKLERGLFEENRKTAIFITENEKTVELNDITIKNTLSYEKIYFNGNGIRLQKAANLKVERGIIEDNRQIGVIAMEDCYIGLNNVFIGKTNENDCYHLPKDSPYFCPEDGSGTGVGAFVNSRIELNNVHIDNNKTVGAQLARKGYLTGNNIYVSNNPIGFNIQNPPEDYDFYNQITGLIMENNTINFDSQILKLPELIE